MGYITSSEQYPKLITAQPGQSVASPDVAAQKPGDLLEQFIAGNVSAGIINDFELIKVEIKQYMMAPRFVSIFERMGQTALKLPAIGRGCPS